MSTSVTVIQPPENLPDIGTVENPVTFYDGEDVFVAYEVSHRRGGGVAVVAFKGIIDFRITPMTSEGLRQCRYPIKAWRFSEIHNAAEINQWKVLKPRYWFVSFNDVTLEILFEDVTLMLHDTKATSRRQALLNALN